MAAHGGALSALSEDNRVKLVVERNELEPDFKFGIPGLPGGAVYTKDQVIDQVQQKTKLGVNIVDSEVTYLNHMISDLSNSEAPLAKPKIPEIKPEKKPSKTGTKFYHSHALFCEDTVTDDLTKDAASYRIKEVHSRFKKRGFLLDELIGNKTDRANLKALAIKKGVNYISGIGHGDAVEYTGHKATTVMKNRLTTVDEVNGKIVHLLSCLTAQQLGPYLVRKGAKAFAGYSDEFWAIFDQPDTPVNEMDLFWECDCTFDIMMLMGATVEKAHNMTIAMFDACIDLVPNTSTASSLLHDQMCLTSPVSGRKYGDKKAKISAWFADLGPLARKKVAKA